MLWLALAAEEKDLVRRYVGLGVCEARDENEAFYKFMHMQLHPAYVVQLPDYLVYE